MNIPEIITFTVKDSFDYKEAIETLLVVLKVNNVVDRNKIITNLKLSGSNISTGLEALVDNTLYRFNASGVCTTNSTWLLCNINVVTTVDNKGTEATRKNGTTTETINISSMLPRELFAMAAMLAIISGLGNPLTMLGDYNVLKIASISFNIALAMMLLAANCRANTVSEPTLTNSKEAKATISINEVNTATDKLLYSIYAMLLNSNVDNKRRFDALTEPTYNTDETIKSIKGIKTTATSNDVNVTLTNDVIKMNLNNNPMPVKITNESITTKGDVTVANMPDNLVYNNTTNNYYNVGEEEG